MLGRSKLAFLVSRLGLLVALILVILANTACSQLPLPAGLASPPPPIRRPTRTPTVETDERQTATPIPSQAAPTLPPTWTPTFTPVSPTAPPDTPVPTSPPRPLPYTQEDLQVFASGFELANGLGLDPDGTVYATDAGASILYRIDKPDGEKEPVIEGLVFPRDIRFDEDGGLVATVIREDRVVTLGEDGEVSTLLDGLEGASGLVIADDGTLYVSGLLDGRVLRMEPDEEPETLASGLAGPSGLTLDSEGNLYVGLFNAEEGEPSVLRYSPDGGEPEVVAAGFTKTLGVVWGPDDVLYVSHVLDGRAVIVRFPSEGTSELFLDTDLPGPLLGPLFGPDGFAYIMSVDGETNAVHRFDVRGHVPIR